MIFGNKKLLGVGGVSSITLTTAGAIGRFGPSSGQVATAYASESWYPDQYSITNGIQSITIATTGNYEIMAVGAYGGEVIYSIYGTNGGYGAIMIGEFSLTQGDIINVVVGQKGSNGDNNQYGGSGGGGGATYVYKGSTVILVAGGGGGANYYSGAIDLGDNAYTTTTGIYTGTVTGGGSIDGTGGCGGGGTIGNGGDSTYGTPGLSYSNGSAGGASYTSAVSGGLGGFGGGGGAGFSGGGGAGGYSGGDGGGNAAADPAGGGGSYNSGTNQSNTINTIKEDGYIIITKV